MHSSDCDLYHQLLHIVVLIHFIVSSAAAPKSYYEYDSKKQINASEASNVKYASSRPH